MKGEKMSSQSRIIGTRVQEFEVCSKNDVNHKSDEMTEEVSQLGIVRPLRISQEVWSLESLNGLTTVAGAHEHVQTTDCLSSHSSCKILGTQLISA